jgi:hypothetical protein
VAGVVSEAPTPGVVPTYYRGTPGWTAVARGEPLPGVVLELRLPGTSFVLGGVISPEVRVQNGTSSDLVVTTGVIAKSDNQHPIPIDERSVLYGGLRGQPGFMRGGPTVPAGQTWSFPTAVQLPFDAAPTVELVATAAFEPQVGTPALSPVAVYSEIPLTLTTPGPEHKLQVQLQVDRKQWCLRATTASGGTPDGPLSWSARAMVAGGGITAYSQERVPGNTWAGYWNPTLFQRGSGQLSASVWVGGANYAATRVDASAP